MFDRSEVETLLHSYRCNSISETEAARLEAILASSEEARRLVARTLMAESMLRTELQVSEVSRMFAGDYPLVEHRGPGAMATPSDLKPTVVTTTALPRVESPRTGVSPSRASFYLGSLLACVLVGLTVANLLLLNDIRSARNEGQVEAGLSNSTVRLVNSTLCLWDVTSSSPMQDQRIAPNKSLRLLEGIAEMQLQGPAVGNAMLRIEGPAGWTVSSEGQPNLDYGKMTIDAKAGGGSLWVDTPLGRVTLSEDASVGVVCFGTELEVHVFHGTAQVDSIWIDRAGDAPHLYVGNNEMVSICINEQAPCSEVYAKADPSRFASRISMATDDLRLGEEYAESVKQLGPVGYWRFDSIVGDSVQNEMGPEFPLRMVGEIKVRRTPQNEYLEFIDQVTPECLNAALVTDEPFTGVFDDECSIEMWIKPSHFHLASMVGLIKGPVSKDGRANHGVLLELGGPHPLRGGISHPGRIRFTNRFPAAQEPIPMESTFSKSIYLLRRWQHVVAVKSSSERRIYINGELVAKTPETRPVGDDLTLLVGRLHARLPERRFVGQLDELAIYPRALTTEEVKAHHSHSNSEVQSPSGI